MKEKFLRFHRIVKEWITQVLFRKFLTPIVLVFVYFLVVGPTSLVAKIFFRDALKKSSGRNDSNWIETKNYEDSLETSYGQS